MITEKVAAARARARVEPDHGRGWATPVAQFRPIPAATAATITAV
jgi:hypothetical protein